MEYSITEREILEKKQKRLETYRKASQKYYLKNKQKVIERVKQYNKLKTQKVLEIP
jgi:hypothetical protein